MYLQRIYLQNSVYELALQGNTGSVIGWSDTVKLEGVMMSLAKELKIELYGFQIRPWKAMR
ncbi:hypothetical protein EON63_21590 [archaeon]|nr:MAG: hypothetical protein EON63_21590 [archaeon]